MSSIPLQFVRRFVRHLVTPLAFGPLVACATPSLAPPPGFARLGSDGVYDDRAASADGLVVAVRSESNAPHASLDFWARAVDVRLQRDGYNAEEAHPVRSARGLEGRQLRYTRGGAGRALRYWVTLFVTRDHVYVVEAAGDREDFDATAAAVERTILSLDAT